MRKIIDVVFITLLVLFPVYAQQVTTSWTNSTSPGVVGYRVYRRTPTGAYALIGMATTAPIVDATVAAGATYMYVATAFDGTGRESIYSNEVTAIIPIGPPPPPPPPPPGGMKVISLDLRGTGTAMGTGETAGVVPKKFWNVAAGVSGTMPLIDELGAGTNVTATWRGYLGWRLPITDTAGNLRMMRGYLDAADGVPATVTVSGLPDGTYDVYVYTDGDNSNTRVYNYSVTGSADSTVIDATPNFSGTFTLNSFYIKRSFTGSTFTITATPVSSLDGYRRAVINGVQIVPVTVLPPPVSIAIAPTAATILTGTIQQFTGTVSNATNTGVTYTATGGAISATGLYTAGNAPGTFTVTATAATDTTKTATASVTVNPQPPTLTLDCATAKVGFTSTNMPAGTSLTITGVAAGLTRTCTIGIP